MNISTSAVRKNIPNNNRGVKIKIQSNEDNSTRTDYWARAYEILYSSIVRFNQFISINSFSFNVSNYSWLHMILSCASLPPKINAFIMEFEANQPLKVAGYRFSDCLVHIVELQLSTIHAG